METILTTENILIALGMTLVAGLCTGIGSLMAFFTKHTDTKFLSMALGLSAGVMIYISFMELMPEAMDDMMGLYPEKTAAMYALLAFFAGMGLIALIDFLVPEDENPHEYHVSGGNHRHLKRTGIMLALTIGIHNFPEGIATFVSGLESIDRHSIAHIDSSSHTQYTGGYSSVGADISCYRQPPQGSVVFCGFGICRTGGRAVCSAVFNTYMDAGSQCRVHGRRSRCYGLYSL